MKDQTRASQPKVRNPGPSHLQPHLNPHRLLNICLAAATSLLFFLILAYRLNLAPDIHMDEILYYRAAHQLATSGENTWETLPIFSHPPLQFLCQALFLRLIGEADSFEPFAGVYSARLLNALAAAFTAALVFGLIKRLGGLRAALIGSAILLLDPFVVRINRRNMLETMAEMWVVAALFLFWQWRDRLTARSTLLIGLFLGLALLTKEIAVFNYGALLLFVLLAGRWKDIKNVLAIGGVALLVWSLFPFWAWRLGQWQAFVEGKTFLLRRLLGQVQVTGWNRPGVSFIDALRVNLSQYATSYALIALGIVMALILFFTWRDEQGRFVLAWAASMYIFFAYSIVGGALNDQFFYFLMAPVVVLLGTMLARWLDLLTGAPNPAAPPQASASAPGVLVLANIDALPRFVRRIDRWLVAVSDFLQRAGRRAVGSGTDVLPGRGAGHCSSALLALTVLAGLTMLTYNVYVWGKLFAVENDRALYELTQYVYAHIPSGTEINSMSEDEDPTLRWMMPDYKVVTLRSPAEIEERGVEYAILSTKNLWGAYGGITVDYYDWIETHGQEVFHVYGNTHWDVTLHRLALGNE